MKFRKKKKSKKEKKVIYTLDQFNIFITLYLLDFIIIFCINKSSIYLFFQSILHL